MTLLWLALAAGAASSSDAPPNLTYGSDTFAGANQCAVGRFHNAWADACVACPAGKFQRLEHAHECETCPSGKYQMLSGQNQCDANHCAAGTIPTWNNACTACSPGQYAPLHAATCTRCDMLKGLYSFTTGAAACTHSTCEAGWMQTTAGCIMCGENKYQPSAGQPTCINCPPAWQLVPHRYHTGGLFNPTYAGRGATVCSTERPGAPQRCTHMTCQYNGNHLRVAHERAEAHGTRHHCFWRAASTIGAPPIENHCCRGLSPAQCVHQKQLGHCDRNASGKHGECLCVCFSPEDTAI